MWLGRGYLFPDMISRCVVIEVTVIAASCSAGPAGPHITRGAGGSGRSGDPWGAVLAKLIPTSTKEDQGFAKSWYRR